MLAVGVVSGRVRFEVHVAPRARREGVVGEHDGALKVALTAPPVEGAANAALIALLAEALGVSRSAVRIVRGQSSRRKALEVEGVEAAAIHALLG